MEKIADIREKNNIKIFKKIYYDLYEQKNSIFVFIIIIVISLI
jgi:hypothetical protein